MGRCHRSVVPVPSSEVVLATALASPGSGEESREAEEGRDTSPSLGALPGLEPCEVNLGMVCTLREDFGLPEGKDSLFRWPSDDKLKSEGPLAEGDSSSTSVSLDAVLDNGFDPESSVTAESCGETIAWAIELRRSRSREM
mmetsp:Transcript_72140/g.118724  ORF Transcript_72140/g.118724 Transcript_72140/m.118724 type:complete len:141 (-) Transcript_72140:518-940(-)